MTGRAEFLPAGDIQWSNLKGMQAIEHNTTLRTSNSSRAEFLFSKGWFFIMNEGSHLKYLYARGQKENQVSFSSLHGDLYFHIDQCEGCHNTRVSWYLDSNVVQATEADFSTSKKGNTLYLHLFDGSMVVRRGVEVALIKAPQTVVIRPQGIQTEPLSRGMNKDSLTAPEVEVAKILSPPQNLRKAISFHAHQAPHLSSSQWNVPKFLLDWSRAYLDSLGVYYQTHDGRSLRGYHEVDMNIKEFVLQSSAASWSLMVEIEFILINPISHAKEDQWTFKRLYRGKVYEGVDLRLLKYLPLDSRKQKIKNSLFEQFWSDYQSEVLERIVDPLFTSSDAVF